MKTIIAISLIFFFFLNNYAQISVNPTKTNIVYIGVENPLTIMANGYDCKDLRVKVSQGELISYGECKFIFKPSLVGEVDFSIYHEDSLVDKYSLRCVYMPDDIYEPTILGGTKPNGRHTKTLSNQLTKQSNQGVVIIVLNFDFYGKVELNSFKVITCFEDELITIYNKGPYFNERLKEIIDKSTIGQSFTFLDFNIKTLDGRNLVLEDIITVNIDGVSDSCKKPINFKEKSFVYQCGCDCLIFRNELNDSTEILDKVCFEGDTIKTIQKNIFENKIEIINQAEKEKEIYEIEDGKYSGLYQKYKNDKLVIEGIYSKAISARDTITIINPIDMLPMEKEIFEFESVKNGKWIYYNNKGKAIKTEIYEMGELREIKE